METIPSCRVLDSPSFETESSRLRVERVEYLEFWVGNAKLCQKFYSRAFGFAHIAVKGLETGDKLRTSHVISQNNATFVFTSTHSQDDVEFNEHLSIHGDAIKDIAFQCKNVYGLYEQAVANGAKGIEAPHETEDKNGIVVIAKIGAPFGDTTHTLIDKSRYSGVFLPGFQKIENSTPCENKISNIDHVALACEQGRILEGLEWYINCLGFHQFLCNDKDTLEGFQVEGMEGGLTTCVAASSYETYALKIVFVEAHNQQENSKNKNQIAEFIEFNGNKAGTHHIALHTDDIVDTVSTLKSRGVEFITVPSSYYEQLFAENSSNIKEDHEKLQELGILLDITYKKDAVTPNLLLQTFTVPLQDRPTFFFEIISRKGSTGFGDRTIKALFEAIERLQQKRSA